MNTTMKVHKAKYLPLHIVLLKKNGCVNIHRMYEYGNAYLLMPK